MYISKLVRLLSKHGGFMMTGEPVGSSVDTTGHHPSLNDVALWRERPRTIPRQSLTQRPSIHSRHEGGGGGLSFQQPLAYATYTPVSIHRLARGDRQPINRAQD